MRVTGCAMGYTDGAAIDPEEPTSCSPRCCSAWQRWWHQCFPPGARQVFSRWWHYGPSKHPANDPFALKYLSGKTLKPPMSKSTRPEVPIWKASDSAPDGLHKKTGQICWREKLSVSDLESSSLAGFFAFIGSNLCTRP